MNKITTQKLTCCKRTVKVDYLAVGKPLHDRGAHKQDERIFPTEVRDALNLSEMICWLT